MTQDELHFFSGHGGALPLYVALREQVLARWPEVEIKAARTQITFKDRSEERRVGKECRL